MNWDELRCRAQSIIDLILGRENDYITLDSDNNLYRRGRKFKAKIKDLATQSYEERGYTLVDIKNNVRFYRKVK